MLNVTTVSTTIANVDGYTSLYNDVKSTIEKQGEYIEGYCDELIVNENWLNGGAKLQSNDVLPLVICYLILTSRGNTTSREITLHHGFQIEEWKRQLEVAQKDFYYLQHLSLAIQVVFILIAAIYITLLMIDLWMRRKRKEYERTSTIVH